MHPAGYRKIFSYFLTLNAFFGRRLFAQNYSRASSNNERVFSVEANDSCMRCLRHEQKFEFCRHLPHTSVTTRDNMNTFVMIFVGLLIP